MRVLMKDSFAIIASRTRKFIRFWPWRIHVPLLNSMPGMVKTSQWMVVISLEFTFQSLVESLIAIIRTSRMGWVVRLWGNKQPSFSFRSKKDCCKHRVHVVSMLLSDANFKSDYWQTWARELVYSPNIVLQLHPTRCIGQRIIVANQGVDDNVIVNG